MQCDNHNGMQEIRPRSMEEKAAWSTHARFIKEGEKVWRYYVRKYDKSPDFHKRICNVCSYAEYQYVDQMKTTKWFDTEVLNQLMQIQSLVLMSMEDTDITAKFLNSDDISVTYRFFIPKEIREKQLRKMKEVNNA